MIEQQHGGLARAVGDRAPEIDKRAHHYAVVLVAGKNRCHVVDDDKHRSGVLNGGGDRVHKPGRPHDAGAMVRRGKHGIACLVGEPLTELGEVIEGVTVAQAVLPDAAPHFSLGLLGAHENNGAVCYLLPEPINRTARHVCGEPECDVGFAGAAIAVQRRHVAARDPAGHEPIDGRRRFLRPLCGCGEHRGRERQRALVDRRRNGRAVILGAGGRRRLVDRMAVHGLAERRVRVGFRENQLSVAVVYFGNDRHIVERVNDGLGNNRVAGFSAHGKERVSGVSQ